MIREYGVNEVWLLFLAARWTVLLSLTAFVGGSLIGLAVTVLRVSPSAILRGLTIAWIQVFQGTPLLMQLFIVHYGGGLVGIRLDAWTSAAIGLSCYASAFLAEIWRGCVEAVPRGQWEVSRALSFTFLQQVRYVVGPQAVRIAIPLTVGFMVQIVKGTSLASVLGFVELTRAGQMIANITFAPISVYLTVAAIYLALCWPLSFLSQKMERRYDVYRRTS
jgi:polar amino acid transport system permease protein